MKAVLLERHGDPSVLRWAEITTPGCGPGQVRVRVEACALNHLDIWVRRGLPRRPLEFPHILGADVAGRVDAVGGGVVGIREGDSVVVNPGTSCGCCRRCLSGRDNLCDSYGLLGEDRWGGYAEYVVVPAANVAPRPEVLSVAEAAALPLTFVTAWQMLVDLARVQPGETVLVLAGGSGVGVASTQIAKLFGARVIATASTEEKRARAREVGADEVANHSAEGFVAEVKRLTGGRGADVVVEHVGAITWPSSLRAVARGGRLVTCGATAGHDARTDLRHVFFRQIQILGSTMASKSALLAILGHVASGKLRPIVDTVFPLRDAAQAHRHLEERKSFGKVVLSVS